MRDETREFFDSRGLQKTKLVARCKLKGISPEQIEQAMEDVFDLILGGEIIDPLQIARRVWARAAEIDITKPDTVELSIKQYKVKVNDLKMQIAELEKKAKGWKRERILYWIMMALLTGAGAIGGMAI